VHGFYHGIESVVPTAMVLLFVGREDSLGFIQSISALVAALAIYAVGRRSNERTRMRILLFWSVSTILGALAFGIWFSVVGVIIYFMISALSGDFRWVSLGAVMYDRVEQEALAEQSHAYPYLLDREFFLNAGRILGLLVFWGCSQIAPLPTLRFILLGAAVSQLAIPALARRVMTAKSA
jgi:YQGE family putative transporter